jgi:hypothetical protein
MPLPCIILLVAELEQLLAPSSLTPSLPHSLTRTILYLLYSYAGNVVLHPSDGAANPGPDPGCSGPSTGADRDGRGAGAAWTAQRHRGGRLGVARTRAAAGEEMELLHRLIWRLPSQPLQR